MDWQDFGTALALMLVFEGLSPFIWPGRMKKLAELVQQSDEKSIRTVAAMSMGAGLALLYFVRA